MFLASCFIVLIMSRKAVLLLHQMVQWTSWSQ